MNPLLQWGSALALVAVMAPAARLLADAEVRRLFPRFVRAVVAGLVAWTMLTIALALAAPGWLPWAAVAALVLSAAASWRARNSHGTARGLPPGSLSVVAAVRAVANRGYYREQFARHGPIFKAAQFGSNVICVHGLDRGHRLLRENADALGPTPLPFTGQILGGFLRYMDDPTHDVYGPLFRKALSRGVAEDALLAAREAARRELASWPTAGVAPAPAMERIAFAALARALFGVTPGTPRGELFASRYARLAPIGIMHPLNRTAREALGGLREFALEAAAAGGEDALPRSALAELRRVDPRMPDATCADNLVFMFKIAVGNVGGLLSWLTVHLALHAEWRPSLREAAQAAPGSAIPDALDAFVMETLRLSQSEYLYRTLQRDLRFEGFLLPRGYRVRVCVAESHRDEAVFADAERFTERFVGHRPAPTEYSPFGVGRHACNGAGLASSIGRAWLAELAMAPGLRVAAADQPVRDLRHWSHWRPGPGLRIAVDRD